MNIANKDIVVTMSVEDAKELQKDLKKCLSELEKLVSHVCGGGNIDSQLKDDYPQLNRFMSLFGVAIENKDLPF